MGIFTKKNRNRKPKNSRNTASTPANYSYYSSKQQRPAGGAKSGVIAKTPKQTASGVFHSIVSALVGLAILASVVYSLGLTPNPRVTIVSPPEPAVSVERGQGQYAEAIGKILSESILSRSKLTIDTRKVEQKIVSKFPEIASASLSIPVLGQTPIIKLFASELGAVLISTAGEPYLMSKEGVILSSAKDWPLVALDNAPKITDQSGATIEPGKRMLTVKEADFIAGLVYQLTAQGYKPIEMILPRAPSEIDIKIESKPFVIKFNLATDPRAAAGSVVALLKKLEKEAVNPSEYIDARVEEKLFYR